MKFRIHMSVAVDATSEYQAAEFAEKLEKLLKSPGARMMVASEGIQLSGDDGRPIVYRPQREVA